MPIRQKLMLIAMGTTALALLLAGIGIVSADLVLFRSNLQNELSALARITADDTTAALAFDDPAAAAETLGALRARSHLVIACEFNGEKQFARYARNGATMSCPLPEAREASRFDRHYLTVWEPILLQGRRLGTLVLVYDLGAVYERVKLYGILVVGVFLLSTLIAFLLSARLRSLVTTPVTELARVSAVVSKTRDYGVRAQKISGDELGLLVDAFNEMLSVIQLRDSELRLALLAREVALEDAQRARNSLEGTLARVAGLNDELQATNKSLARSNEDLERFAFIASHDLQEPLRMITVYSQLLVKRFSNAANAQVSDYIEIIESGTKRMRDLLADLLAYAEIGAKVDEPAQDIDLAVIVRNACEQMAMAISESGAVITVAQLPVIRGFGNHFTSLFQNLIGNAVKYRGDRPVEIDIVATRADNQIRICVSDNGIGIAPEYHTKIFAAFKRLHGKSIPGTGIGLAICQRVVERYGGRIWVESESGHGSNFIFTLPDSLLAPGSFRAGN